MPSLWGVEERKQDFLHARQALHPLSYSPRPETLRLKQENHPSSLIQGLKYYTKILRED